MKPNKTKGDLIYLNLLISIRNQKDDSRTIAFILR